MKNAQIHRFGDKVAISLPGKGETIYLTPDDARAVADAMRACASNIEAQPKFSESTFATNHIVLSSQK